MSNEFKSVLAQLSENDAIRVASSLAGLTSDGEITRAWKVNDDKRALCLRFLDTYCSVTNYPVPEADAPEPAGKLWMTGVTAGRESYAGVWRLVRNYTTPDMPGYILQDLRAGWIETLTAKIGEGPAETVLWDEARVLAPTRGDGTTKFLYLVWPNVSPYKVNAIAVGLQGIPHDDTRWRPMVGGEDHGAGWYRLAVTHGREQDGSATIQMLLVHSPSNVTDYENWRTENEESVVRYFGVPKAVRDTVVAAHKLLSPGVNRIGASARSGFNAETLSWDVVLMWPTGDGETMLAYLSEKNVSYTETTSDWYGVPKTTVDGVNLAGAGYPTTEGVMYAKRVSRAGNGRWNMTVTTRNAIAAAISFQVNLGNGVTEIHNIALNQPTTHLAGSGTGPGRVPGALEGQPAAGKERRVGRPDRAVDGTWSYHEVLTPLDSGIGYSDGDYVLILDKSERRVWDTALEVYRSQARLIWWKHQFKIFTSSSAAHAWSREGEARGYPVRHVDTNKYLATKVTMFIDAQHPSGLGWINAGD